MIPSVRMVEGDCPAPDLSHAGASTGGVTKDNASSQKQANVAGNEATQTGADRSWGGRAAERQRPEEQEPWQSDPLMDPLRCCGEALRSTNQLAILLPHSAYSPIVPVCLASIPLVRQCLLQPAGPSSPCGTQSLCTHSSLPPALHLPR